MSTDDFYWSEPDKNGIRQAIFSDHLTAAPREFVVLEGYDIRVQTIQQIARDVELAMNDHALETLPDRVYARERLPYGPGLCEVSIRVESTCSEQGDWMTVIRVESDAFSFMQTKTLAAACWYH